VFVTEIPLGGKVGPDPNAYAHERRSAIARLVEVEGRVRVRNLGYRFGVSVQTIRKDLAVLDANGRITRAHGGATSVDPPWAEGAFDLRERLQRDEKAAIGIAAASSVTDGQSIALDASTSALHAARALRNLGGWSQLTVVTNGLRIASELAACRGITVVIPGGWVRWEALSVVGSIGAGVFDQINVQTAFIGAAGFTLETGLSDATEEEAQIKRAMVAVSREVVPIIDHTKFGRTAIATFCHTSQISRIITDSQAPLDIVGELRARQVQVLTLDTLDERPREHPIGMLAQT
jgi:DeoR/GlpR family transcriptional regulator of sugar metabolism